jgi:hypothetical protein
MSSFGTDDTVFLTAEDLAESPRFAESTSKNNMLAFTLKKFAHDAKHSAATNLYMLESGGSIKQMTRLETGGVSNPAFAPDVAGSNDAVCNAICIDNNLFDNCGCAQCTCMHVPN